MFAIDIPKLMQDWDFEENEKNHISPENITAKSKKKVAWKCHVCGGTWIVSMKERRGCPFCNHYRVLPRFNDLATTDPELALQWDYTQNRDLRPENVTRGSQKKVFWRCENGHVWDAQINSRVSGQGCPYCNNRRVLTGYNDLATVHPDVAEDWDYYKNRGITPQTIISGSKKKVWWKCRKCGYEWETTIANRSRGNGCPSCAHVIVHAGKNDVASRFPQIANEWDYERNTLSPNEVAIYSSKRVSWVCPRGHQYFAVVSDRIKGTGCPICSEERRVSFPEKALFYYVNRVFKNVLPNYKDSWLGRFELDIFLPEYKIAVEYDGIYGHSSKDGVARDQRKNKVCDEHGIKLIRIRENGCPRTETTSLDYVLSKNDTVEDAVKIALSALSKMTGVEVNEIDINIDRDSGAIYSLVEYNDKEQSLQRKFPDIATLWHPEKNGRLTPDNVSYMSSKTVWWLGKCGHEWRSTVAYEGKSGLCPYCTGKRVLEGFNDLKTTNSILADEWDYEKNEPLEPNRVTAGSGKKVWWKCQKGHSWNASIVSRNRGNGCPICANRIVLPGYNDVGSIDWLMIDWDKEKNLNLPEELCIGSDKKVWWKCHICGYRWYYSIADRYHGSKCPECAKKERSSNVAATYVKKRGSLREKRPELIEEWDFVKNIEINPDEVTCGCRKKVWWICKQCGHNWSASITSRTREVGGGCPKCADKEREKKRQLRRLEKNEPISITHPAIASQWNYEKNNGLTPESVTHGSGKKVWWKCSHCGYEWLACVYDRCRNNGTCVKCHSSPSLETV